VHAGQLGIGLGPVPAEVIDQYESLQDQAYDLAEGLAI